MALKNIVTSDGIDMPSDKEIVAELRSEALLFDLPIVENSNDDKALRWRASVRRSKLNYIAQVYKNTDLLLAEGSALDKLAAHRGERRRQPKYAIGEVTLTMKSNNTAYEFADKELVLATTTGIVFKNNGAFSLNTNTGTLKIAVIASETGVGSNIVGGALTEINSDPSLQIDSITNTDITGGSELETDQLFRKRLLEKNPNPITMRRLVAALSAISWIRYSRVFTNNIDQNALHGVAFGKTAVVIDDGSTGTTMTINRKKDIWNVIADNSLIMNWHKDANSIELRFSERGMESVYQVSRPKITNVQVFIDIQKTDGTTNATIIADVFSALNNAFGGYESGTTLTSTLIEKEIINRIPFLQEGVSNIDSQVRIKQDGVALTDGWNRNVLINMGFANKPALTNADVYIKINGSRVT